MAADPQRSDRRPFVGRDLEIERLRLGLDDVAAGRGRLFMLVGEPGIGKTRLADDVATEAAGRAMPVLWGRCWESGGAPAYWPWTQIFRACTSLLGGDALAALPRAAPDLVHIVPELHGRGAEPAGLESADPEQGRFRVLDAAASFLRAAAAARPLVLLLDDLHAADPSSLLLLRFVARELRAMPLLVVGTYREAEAARDAAVGPLLADILRDGERIPLRGLSSGAVACYIAGAAPRAVEAATVDAVYQVTEGNPLFLSELIRLWIAEPSPRPGDPPTPVGLAIPEELRATLRRRLAPLAEPVRRLLTAAAVQGREFDAGMVERVFAASAGTAAPSAGEVIAAIDAARAAGVVQPVAGENRRPEPGAGAPSAARDPHRNLLLVHARPPAPDALGPRLSPPAAGAWLQ